MNIKPNRIQKRAMLVDEGIQLVWESLESHLKFTHQESLLNKKNGETAKFHKKCVKEYARLIQILSELY